MGGIEIWLVAIGLAMDCFAVSIASGIMLKRVIWRPMLVMAFSFGLFQGLMTLGGWFCAGLFSHLVEQVDHWIAFLILAFLGIRMIIGAFKEDGESTALDPTRLGVVLLMAIATSIDALAVGVSYGCLGDKAHGDMPYAVAVIGLVSFVMSVIGLFIGICCGTNIARKLKAELWGGVILLLIGIKIIMEHLLG